MHYSSCANASKYTNDDNLKEFLSILQQPISKWKIKVDRTGGKYNGIRLKWNYDENTLIQDIPNYVADNIARLNLQIRNRRTPAKYIPPQYGKTEMAPEETETPCTPEESKLIERVHGIFLYYSRKVDPIIKRALLDISLDLKSPTKKNTTGSIPSPGIYATLPACPDKVHSL